MLEAINVRAASVGDVLFNASRQMWLAGLGAAVVTRDWAEKEARTVFRSLVREGTAVESRTFRFVGDRLDTSFNQASTLWKHARRTVTTTVNAYAGTAATLVRESLPAVLTASPARTDATKPVKRSAKQVRKSPKTRPVTKRAPRTKAAGKRA